MFFQHSPGDLAPVGFGVGDRIHLGRADFGLLLEKVFDLLDLGLVSRFRVELRLFVAFVDLDVSH